MGADTPKNWTPEQNALFRRLHKLAIRISVWNACDE